MDQRRASSARAGAGAGIFTLAALLAGCGLATSDSSAPTSTVPSTAFRTIPVTPPKPTEPTTTLAPGVTSAPAAQNLQPQQNLDPEVRAVYTVKAGDAPAGIARKYGVPLDAFIAINGMDPKKPAVYVGQKVKIPRILPPTTLTEAGEKAYVVEKGDSLLAIANKFGIPYQVILDLNGLQLTSNIRPGQLIKLPG